MKTVSIYSMKGGVGKTASVVNLSYLAAKEGLNTLICDMDPQASSTYYFRIKASKGFSPGKFIKGGKTIDKNIKGTNYPYLDLLPSKLSYRNFDLVLNDLKNSRLKLKKIFSELKGDYDYLFLDCPPGISLLSENIFNASDIVLTPVIPTTLSVRTHLKMLKFSKNKGLDLKRIHPFFSMVEKRKLLHQQIMDKMEKRLGNFLKTRIPYRSDVEKMGIYKSPVFEFAHDSFSARSYIELWTEIRML